MASEWLNTTIGSQVTLQRGFDITKAEQRPGIVPVISSSGVSSYHDTASAKGPGVILGRKGVVGSVHYIASDYWPHDTSLWVKDFHENEVRFVYYFFKWMAPQIAAMDVGSANPTLNRNHVHPIQIMWPPKPEQRAIAHILGTLDDKIELNRRMNETLEAMARALFKAWFVDFEPVRAKLEGRWQRGQSLPGLPAHLYDLFPDRLIESELGEIPAGGQVEELGAQIDVLETGRRPKGGVGGIRKGVPSVGAESVLGVGQFEYEKTKYITADFFAGMKSGHAESMDVMLYKDGGKPGDFRPRVAMFGRGFPFERYAINEHVFRIRSKTLGQAFLYLQLSHDRILNDLRNRGGKAAIPGINQTDVRSLQLIVPPRKMLSTFDKIVAPIMESILERARENRTISQLRDALLPKLISGELRIKNINRLIEEVERD